jgi:hypothetical protein
MRQHFRREAILMMLYLFLIPAIGLVAALLMPIFLERP